jgi:hypothetical protein
LSDFSVGFFFIKSWLHLGQNVTIRIKSNNLTQEVPDGIEIAITIDCYLRTCFDIGSSKQQTTNELGAAEAGLLTEAVSYQPVEQPPPQLKRRAGENSVFVSLRSSVT